jgi:cytochrome c-type biogenesis protein CcsB
VAPRSPDATLPDTDDGMTLAQISLYLFSIGAIGLVIAFVLSVVHTTLLAVGRRRAPVPVASNLVPAGATGTSTVSVGDGGGGGPMSYQTQTTAGSLGHAFTWLTFICFLLSLAVRGWIVGRGPWGNMYEFSIAFAAGIVGAYLYLERRYRIRSIAFVPLGVALFLVGYAATLPSVIEPLVPALDNAPLLTIHVSMAMISYGIFAVSFAAALGFLAQGPTDRFAWLPSHKVLDEVAYRAVIIGFPVFAALIILGSYWASIAWGRYWGWDPKETAALVTWLIYAVYLHARNLKGWSGRPAALILVIGFGAVLFTYFGNLYFSGLHSYSGL